MAMMPKSPLFFQFSVRASMFFLKALKYCCLLPIAALLSKQGGHDKSRALLFVANRFFQNLLDKQGASPNWASSEPLSGEGLGWKWQTCRLLLYKKSSP